MPMLVILLDRALLFPACAVFIIATNLHTIVTLRAKKRRHPSLQLSVEKLEVRRRRRRRRRRVMMMIRMMIMMMTVVVVVVVVAMMMMMVIVVVAAMMMMMVIVVVAAMMMMMMMMMIMMMPAGAAAAADVVVRDLLVPPRGPVPLQLPGLLVRDDREGKFVMIMM
jgi:MFS family permease